MLELRVDVTPNFRNLSENIKFIQLCLVIYIRVQGYLERGKETRGVLETSC